MPWATLRTALRGATRHWVQSVVVLVVVCAASIAGVLGLTLATSSEANFQAGVTKRHAPDVVLELNAAKVTPADVARTRHLKGVTAAAGPYPETTVALTLAGETPSSASGGGAVQQQLTVVGRSSSQGPLDDLVCFTSPPAIDSCGWPRRDDQLEVSSFAPVQLEPGGGRLAPVGVRVAVTSLPSRPRLTVVGYAASNIQQDADAWALPAEVRALQRQGAPRQQQMLYTFANASTPSQFNADLSELRNALPDGAIVSSATLSSAQRFSAASGSQRPPYTVTYAVIAILLTLLTVAIVAVATVTASYRRIAALKSIGFTPGEIGAAYGAEIGAPAIIGAAIGVVIGSSWAVALINAGPEHIRVTAPLWVEILTFVAVVVLVAFAAVVPALRVARRPVVAVLSAGQSRARCSRLAQLPMRLPLPRTIAVGASAAAARPAPAVALASVVALGIAAVVLAVGLERSMVDLVVGATSALNGSVVKGEQLVRRMTVIVSVVAVLGVLSAVVMLARQRVRDLAVYKAVGMTPRQLVSTLLAWVLTPAVLAAAVAIPVGVALEHTVADIILSGQTSQLGLVARPASPRVHGPSRPPARGLSRQPPQVFMRNAKGNAHGSE